MNLEYRMKLQNNELRIWIVPASLSLKRIAEATIQKDRSIAPGNNDNNTFRWSGPRGVASYTEALAVGEAAMPTRRLGSLTPCKLS
jgi:hypothetical protein